MHSRGRHGKQLRHEGQAHLSETSVHPWSGQVVPWSPVIPVEVVPNLAGGDTLERHLEDRTTDRRLGEHTELPAETWQALQVAARSVDGVNLRLLTERTEIADLADLIGQGDRLRLLDPGLSREMFAELRWTQAEAKATGDGLDLDALELSASDRAGLDLCRKPEALELLASWSSARGCRTSGGGRPPRARHWASSRSRRRTGPGTSGLGGRSSGCG